jgi:Uma2 family endonuclease
MNFMSTRSAEYLDAIEHLPHGAILVFPDVSWEEYQGLLEDLTDRPGLRVSYDEGRLEVMSPLSEHEDYKEFVLQIARVLADELNTALEPRGSTTWKRRKLRKGAEPDTCFYVTAADRIIGKRNIDLDSDPPPDIVVEIDTTNESMSKFSIYAAFGVPEIWHYDGNRVQMYAWTPELQYRTIPASRFFPILTDSLLQEALEASKTAGHTDALKAFRQRIRTLKP